jgi:hypothetical protein
VNVFKRYVFGLGFLQVLSVVPAAV